ncbi:uncharacterized protein TNCV_1651741 [Trichonephila clavipes]|nr:uncharacterized protein TNCV_1651741 [Trichonephila clavipes]
MPDANKYLRVHTEYVLVKSVGPKSCGLSHERREWRIFPSPSVHAEIVEVEIGGVSIYRPFGEFHRAKSYCHLYNAQRQGVLLAPCHDEFRGPRSDFVRQEVKAHSCTLVDCTTQSFTRAWARQHRHWTVDDWKHVAWSDEFRFQLNRADGRVRVWRQPHGSMDPTCQ